MHFGTMSVRIAFRFPRTLWVPSSLRNPLPVQKEKPNSRKAERAVNSAGSAACNGRNAPPFVCVGKTLCHGRGLSERGLQIVLYIDHGAGDTHAAVPEFGDCARTMDASGFMSTQTRHFSVSSVSEPVSHGARSLGRQS
jgi:hypothetical protein